jgi:hypothetical protein
MADHHDIDRLEEALRDHRQLIQQCQIHHDSLAQEYSKTMQSVALTLKEVTITQQNLQRCMEDSTYGLKGHEKRLGSLEKIHVKAAAWVAGASFVFIVLYYALPSKAEFNQADLMKVVVQAIQETKKSP